MTVVPASALSPFLQRHGIKKIIGFSGGAASAPAEFGKAIEAAIGEASTLFETAIVSEALNVLRPYRNSVAILTGGTSWGIPATATKLAKEAGFFTIGVIPACGEKYLLGPDQLDLRIKVDLRAEFASDDQEDSAKFCSDWGDESAYFCKAIDGVIVFGGRAGTLVEVAHILKVNERRKKRNMEPKFIIPISASGGMAEILPYLPANPEIRGWCMPDRLISQGSVAARILEDKLNLHDLLDGSAYQQVLQAS